MTQITTGIPGLDLALDGGLRPGSVVIISGPPGTGKTIMAQQICFANATADHKAIYFTTLSESTVKLVKHLEPFEFFDTTALGTRIEHVHVGDLLREVSAKGLEPVLDEIIGRVFDEHPAVVVIDSAKMLREFVGGTRLREALYDLTSRIGHTDTTLLLIGEYTLDELSTGVEFSLADGIIQLSYESRETADRRWLRVVKMRGGAHLEGKHTYRIEPSGFTVYPRIETYAETIADPIEGTISTGVPRIDELMGGGIGAGDATVVVGPTGVGKTIFGMSFVAEAIARGEHCLYVTFQDSADRLLARAREFGWELDSELVEIFDTSVSEIDLDVLSTAVRSALAGGRIRRVVIDSLAELVAAARESGRFPAYARSLAGIVRSAGASLLITSETTTIGESAEPWEGLMFLFSNVVLLRYFERSSYVGRAVNIVKMRNSGHDLGVHEFTVSEIGLTVGNRLEHTTGILGWAPLLADT
jgi:circadian clock protein KaiC